MALPPDTQELLDALDRYKEVRGTLPLFDALWSNDPARVYEAFAEHLTHPVADGLTVWLNVRGIARPVRPTNDAVLQQKGVEDVAAWVEKHEKEVLKLRRERDAAVMAGSDALKAANGLGLVLVVVAAAGVIGWLAAFGVMPFRPMDLPEGRPEKQDGSKSGAQDDGNGGGR